MSETQNTSPSLEIFVDRLVEEKGLDTLEAEVVAQIKKDLLDRVEDHVNAAILASLPPEKLEPFEKLLQGGNPEISQKFCHDNIPDLEQVMAAALLNFRSIYLA